MYLFKFPDLYGQAAQASIIDDSIDIITSPDAAHSTISNTTLNGNNNEPKLRFHACHGPNARITNGGLTASRPKALGEFNGSIVFSNRPLRQRELFEVVLETMIDHWNGSCEIGNKYKNMHYISITSGNKFSFTFLYCCCYCQ